MMTLNIAFIVKDNFISASLSTRGFGTRHALSLSGSARGFEGGGSLAKGASIYDVHKILVFFDTLPPYVHKIYTFCP